MRKILSWVAAVLVFAACSSKAEDVDKVCEAFRELSAQPNLSAMDYKQRFVFVDQHVRDKLSRFSQTMTMWDAMGACEPSRCYPMFQRMAEELLEHPWSCPKMDSLASTMHPPVLESSP